MRATAAGSLRGRRAGERTTRSVVCRVVCGLRWDALPRPRARRPRARPGFEGPVVGFAGARSATGTHLLHQRARGRGEAIARAPRSRGTCPSWRTPVRAAPCRAGATAPAPRSSPPRSSRSGGPAPTPRRRTRSRRRLRRSRRPRRAGPPANGAATGPRPSARPPAMRTAALHAVDRGERGVHVRRLRVVHEAHAVDEGHDLASVVLRCEARDPPADRLGRRPRTSGSPRRPRRRPRGTRHVLHRPVRATRFPRCGRPARRRCSRPRRPGAAPMPEPDDRAGSGSRHGGGALVVAVPDVRVALALRAHDPALRVDVRLLRPVPVEMVGGQVQQDRDARMERLDEPQLERRRLDDEHVVAFARRQRERMADVAARDRVVAGRPQAGGDHPGRRRLAVRPGHGQVRDVTEPRPQLELTPDGDPGRRGPREDRGILREHPGW